MVEVPEVLEDVFKYGFFVWNSQTMKAIKDKCSELSSMIASEQGWKKGESQDRDDMRILEGAVTDKVNATSI